MNPSGAGGVGLLGFRLRGLLVVRIRLSEHAERGVTALAAVEGLQDLVVLTMSELLDGSQLQPLAKFPSLSGRPTALRILHAYGLPQSS